MAEECVFIHESLSHILRGPPHVAILVQTPSTVISFNMADMIVFLGRLQRPRTSEGRLKLIPFIDQQAQHVDMSD